MRAHEIVVKAGMSSRPEYYSGRGATIVDLNDRHLQKIAELIEEHHGKDAKKNFVRMVADIPKLTATDFLLNLYLLESVNWDWLKCGSAYNTNGIYATDEATGMGTIMSVLSGMGEVDQTNWIREDFLIRNGIRPHKYMSNNDYNSYY